MNKLDALIFDVDGTLADTERDGHRVAFNAAFRDARLDWEWDVDLYGALLTVTGGKERICHYVENYLQGFSVDGELWDFAAGLHKEKTSHYLHSLKQGKIPLRTGVERLLNEAREADLRLAIATTTTYENVTWLLEATLGESSLDWFEVIGAGDIVPHKKPAPDIYHYVLDKLQLSAAACMAVEDSGNGLLSAQSAGLNTVITINDYTKNDDFSGAAVVLDHLGEVNHPCKVLSQRSQASLIVDSFDYVTVEVLHEIHQG